MFTGLVEDLGSVVSNNNGTIEVSTSLDGIIKGDSVAVNGACLTVTALRVLGATKILSFDVSFETAEKTGLSGLSKGALVNLERALRADSRLGGHIVSGHIDGICVLLSRKKLGNFEVFEFSLPNELSRFVVSKGSVALDGISLTVNDVGEDSFNVTIIPHTIANTALKTKKTGDSLNLETDIMAKYAAKLLRQSVPKNGITENFLKENGF
ncbi:MAG TPA: riboflavin synthase [Elusimicrobia bacterium]|nr:MAG: riboflavin synthase subunit alpha [Elusimicrobia bacterium RIFOXYA12_FULL_49_49]OGS08493.1 MAG: riboflavin synthase subunit alpha [Elusimicrobia bacterium RIFOXYA1_FULL_47_7]OGS11194.1 MAG: riboflavin synthase subunit alpha [Elusimicrobia bacterium RIFOXYB1_FULL_48_9]OGS16028.1 MAG: riboflavin synthase subunit alpha [Elusimicrobia bacterium RIFOXYA2_FULL_47_53]OGS25801.1 MAG: riboflavin synthase subunit alpha [Elusimicrobia bacterium RIFOXYB12_FULL_50_12]OGS30220.1 MAG: riboflavin synt